MSKVQTLRAFVSQRLSAAAEEIFELFERTIAEYEEELCGQRKLLDAVFQPEVRLHRADVQLLLVSKEEDPPEQQDWSPSLDQEDPPEPPHIKEEQEELWTSQEGEQLRGLEEADTTKFTFTPVPVKSEEDDEEKPQSSQLHQRLTEQMKTEADGEDCGGPEPARNSDPATQDKTSDSSEPETDDSCDWEETREPQSGLNTLQINSGCNTGEKSFSCSVCGKQFSQNSNLKRHMRIPTGEKPFSCSVCSRRFIQKVNLTLQTEQKRYSCSVCSKRFTWLYQLENHQCVGRQSSQLHQRLTEQMKTEADGEDCGGPGPAREPQSDVQLLSVRKEEDPPEQQDWSPSLDQEDPPEPPHIKEEQEELWTSQEGEQLRGLEEADITKFTFAPVPVKSEEDDEEKPQSSQLHERLTEQVKTEADGEDCGGPEPARNSDPDTHLQPDTYDKTSDSSEPETDDSCDWQETREPQSGLNPLQNNEVPVSDQECNTGKTSSSSSECATSFGHKGHLQEQDGLQTGEKPYSCSVCGKRYLVKNSLTTHMKFHSEGKRFSCSVCKKTFQRKAEVVRHMVVHTGEKPFSCSVCGKRFARKPHLRRHLTVHTGEKPFSCSVCGKRFAEKSNLSTHLRVHTGEKPFTCSVCKTSFSFRTALSQHMRIHTGEKPFSCSVCDKRFTQLAHMKNHKCAGESSGSK